MFADPSRKRKNVPTGHAEEVALSSSAFKAQHNTYQALGYARDPSGAMAGDLVRAAHYGGRDVVQMRPSTSARAVAPVPKRQKKGDAGIVSGEGAYQGPWARYEAAPALYDEDEAAPGEELASDEEYVEDEIQPAHLPKDASRPALSTDYAGDRTTTESTQFHGENEFDYMGRTYMHVPQDLDLDLRAAPGGRTNYIPRKLIHTWHCSTKAVTAVRFFPGSGHLLLAASADGRIQLFDFYHGRALLRSYDGHSKAVTDLAFDPSGRRFLSASYDRMIKLWDTESGKCLARFSVAGATAHCVRFHPEGRMFLAGMSNHKIVQFDVAAPPPVPGDEDAHDAPAAIEEKSDDAAAAMAVNTTPVQEYDRHLGPVNTVTFVDEGRQFVTTSDDKSLRAWMVDIPVEVKIISEPHMFALNRAAAHPGGKYLALQSSDNQVVVYGAQDRFRQNRKKGFRGHNNAGYAIDLAFSPDGQFLAGGDSGGYCCFWDWRSCKLFEKLQASSAAVMCVAWHPQETSKVVTAGLDGLIKVWD